MLPSLIVEKAMAQGLDVIGICDHNSAENVAAVRKAGEKEGLAVIGGMEITSKEEAHVLGLFDAEEDLLELQAIVYENLHGINDEEAFGEQVVVNEEDEVVDLNRRLLIGATELTVNEIVDMIHSLRGLAIGAHVDRERFSIIGQLGFIPEDLVLDSVEVSSKLSADREDFDFPVVMFSDAHFADDIGKNWTAFRAQEGTVKEIGTALLRKNGRSIVARFGRS
jgi:predicted metal-dependent phosphoesterase TrpH